MNQTKIVKIVVFVPESHADKIMLAMGNAGAGKIGNYSSCFFYSKGQGTFLPEKGANPTIGEIGKLETVDEIRIETVCNRKNLQQVVEAIRKVHPYEEVALDVYPLELI